MAAKVVAQLLPLVLYWSDALDGAFTLTAPLRVMASEALVPLSHTRLSVGVAMVLSRVKPRLLAGPVLPAASTARTCNVWVPSSAVKVLPQLVPFVLYCKVAPASAMTLSAPLLLIRSVALAPLSQAKASVGAIGAVESRVKRKALAVATLPATSVARTLTKLLPSTGTKVLLQIRPLVLYSKRLPASADTCTAPDWLMASAELLPLSHTRLSTGVLMLLSMTSVSVCSALTSPAVLVAVTLTAPLPMAWLGVALQVPLLATVVTRTSPVLARLSRMVSPGVPVPVKLGLSMFVMLSPTRPLSLAALKVKIGRTGGKAGGAWLTLKDKRFFRSPLSWLKLPAASVNRSLATYSSALVLVDAGVKVAL